MTLRWRSTPESLARAVLALLIAALAPSNSAHSGNTPSPPKWEDISPECSAKCGVFRRILEDRQRSQEPITLSTWGATRNGVPDGWLAAAQAPPNETTGFECSSKEVQALTHLVGEHQKKLFTRMISQLRPQLETEAKFRPPTRELNQLHDIADHEEIDLGAIISASDQAKLISKGAASATRRKQSCKQLTPAAIAPDQDLHRSRRQSRGWCFAFSAADLFSAKLHQKVSAFALASTYFQERRFLPSGTKPTEVFVHAGESLSSLGKSTMLEQEGGFPGRLLSSTLDIGHVCTEESSPSEVQPPAPGPGVETILPPGELESRFDAKITAIEETYDALTELFEEELESPDRDLEQDTLHLGLPESKTRPLRYLDPDSSDVMSKVNQAACERPEFGEALKFLFPNLDLKQFLTIATQSRRGDLIAKLSQANCSRVPIRDGTLKRQGMNAQLNPLTQDKDSTAESLLGTLDQQLDRSNPVLIGYSSEGMIDRYQSSRSIKRMGTGGRIARADHASVIVGRDWDEKEQTCRYAIKNSWGPECTMLSPEILCDREGLHWVKQDHLADMLYSLDWLEETPVRTKK